MKNINNKNLKILHITPHLGGGVGTVLLNWFQSDKVNAHSVATLDYANKKAIETCKKISIPLFSQPQKDELLQLIQNSDIVVIHFWNHPLLYDFLIKNELPPIRLILWSHISGLEPPNIITEKILNYPDKFVFTTPISNYCEAAKGTKYHAILSTGGVEHLKELKIKPHDGFNVGYIGTVDYAKMHPDYIKTHKKINADRFIIVGGDKQNEISKDADKRFEFIGKVADIKPYLSQMDVFGYLLNPKHFGTAEQVLQEAMAAGIVPVVLNNKCEESIVEHNKTGLVAKDLTEYINYVELLKIDIELRKTLSLNAQEYAKKRFSLKNLIRQWNEVFNEIMLLPKTARKWQISKTNITSLDVFFESLGKYSELFMLKLDKEVENTLKNSVWQSNSKGTPKQYFEFLGGKELKRIYDLYE